MGGKRKPRPWFDETPKPLDYYDEPGPVGFPPVPDVPFSLDDPHTVMPPPWHRDPP